MGVRLTPAFGAPRIGAVDPEPLLRNPLLGDNRVKLGIMAFNCSLGSTPTMVEEAWPMTWPDNVALARLADGAGFEALLPVGRWKGYPGPTNFYEAIKSS